MVTCLRIGTCSWKYDAWRGLVYSSAPDIDYLAEYARAYDCVEVDQWFWSLSASGEAALPQPGVVAGYARAVPRGFRFGVKMPNSLTLSHRYGKGRTGPLLANPHFLSGELLRRFLECLEPIRGMLGPLMLQFGYLNRRMMPSQAEFLRRIEPFAARLPGGLSWCIETRNPDYLNVSYFRFLRERGLSHVFLQGYYMPSIFELYRQHAGRLADPVVIRLHGPDRAGMEERTGKDWSRIVAPRDRELDALAGMLRDLEKRGRRAWLFVNNHYEGCAPLTIERIRERLA